MQERDSASGMGIVPESAPTYDPHGFPTGQWNGKEEVMGAIMVLGRVLSQPPSQKAEEKP